MMFPHSHQENAKVMSLSAWYFLFSDWLPAPDSREGDLAI